jgi:hypothetical protein
VRPKPINAGTSRLVGAEAVRHLLDEAALAWPVQAG